MLNKIKRKVDINKWVDLKIYVNENDVHYAGGLVNGAYIISHFGDVATLLMMMFDGDEGLLARYNYIELILPISAGNFIEVRGKITKVGNTSRVVETEALCIAKRKTNQTQTHSSSADYLDEPILVAKAELLCVVKKEKQRYGYE
jgi:3-aminobutyryl-CoA ammonia-lyase